MTAVSDALKLSSFLGERQRVGGRFLSDALLDLYGQAGIATSVLLRGVEGFGARHHMRTDTSLSLSEDLPAVVVAVDARTRIETVLHRTLGLVGAGLVTVERARLQQGRIAAPVPGQDGDAAKLTVYVGRRERAAGLPAFVAVCDLLHRHGVAGATALLGVDGTLHGQRERAGLFGRNANVPMMVVAVGDEATISGVLPELDGLLARPLVTLERVQVCKRDGRRLEQPRADARGEGVRQRLTVYTSEAALHDRAPVHRALTRRLRAEGAAGATTLRGVWGFHGDHPPHGDRLLQVGRHAPTVTTVIDTPDRTARWFDIADELTAGRGLVTCELVPAWRADAGHPSAP